MKKTLLPLFTLLITSICFANDSGMIQDSSPLAGVHLSREAPFPPNEIISALKKAYPSRISEISFKKGDWAIKVYDRWLYWAGGRLLPEEDLHKREQYSSHLFYSYPKSLPPFLIPDRETAARLDSILDQREEYPALRHPAFLNGLWRVWDRETSWQRVKTTFFLGYRLLIHRDLLEDLARVEEDIQRRMLVDRELAAFVRSLDRIDGYNWRRIADTETLSVHSYGTAVDLILNRSSEEHIYWLWTHKSGEKFYNTPYGKRFSPPVSFIEAFEKEGFVWGGKWLFFDTIHFEYRPEIMILNGLDS